MIEYEIHGPKSQELSLKRVVLALQENRFPQAVLIDGAAGIGKKKLAIELMQALLCTHPEKGRAENVSVVNQLSLLKLLNNG